MVPCFCSTKNLIIVTFSGPPYLHCNSHCIQKSHLASLFLFFLPQYKLKFLPFGNICYHISIPETSHKTTLELCGYYYLFFSWPPYLLWSSHSIQKSHLASLGFCFFCPNINLKFLLNFCHISWEM